MKPGRGGTQSGPRLGPWAMYQGEGRGTCRREEEVDPDPWRGWGTLERGLGPQEVVVGSSIEGRMRTIGVGKGVGAP